MKISEQVSLIITTYNNPDFLGLVLDSINKQTIYPKEVIIADDGSTQETAQLIERYQKSFPIPVIHSWIPDEGFRVAKSRNMAIARSTAPYHHHRRRYSRYIPLHSRSSFPNERRTVCHRQ